MSDRIPGSSWSNPIWHGKWRIYSADCGPTPFNYAYVHDDYDGEGDSRHGHTRTIEEAKSEIDDYELDGEASTSASGTSVPSDQPAPCEKQSNPNHRDEAG